MKFLAKIAQKLERSFFSQQSNARAKKFGAIDTTKEQVFSQHFVDFTSTDLFEKRRS